MQIRAAIPDDVPALARLHVAAWRWAYPGLLPQPLLDGLSEQRRAAMWTRAIAEMPATSVWVAERDGELVGLASAGPCRDAPGGELYALYVAAGVVGQGVGAALADRACLDLAERGFHEALLWVLEDNRRARTFYERTGWRADGGRKIERLGGADIAELRYVRRLELPPRLAARIVIVEGAEAWPRAIAALELHGMLALVVVLLDCPDVGPHLAALAEACIASELRWVSFIGPGAAAHETDFDLELVWRQYLDRRGVIATIASDVADLVGVERALAGDWRLAAAQGPVAVACAPSAAARFVALTAS